MLSVHTHTYVCMHVYTFMHVCVCLCAHTCVQVCLCWCVWGERLRTCVLACVLTSLVASWASVAIDAGTFIVVSTWSKFTGRLTHSWCSWKGIVYTVRWPFMYNIQYWLWIKNLTSRGNQGTDVDCHSFYQTFRPNLGPSSVVDQGTGHGDLYTQMRGRGWREKGMGGNTGGCVCLQNMQGLGLSNWDG